MVWDLSRKSDEVAEKLLAEIVLRRMQEGKEAKIDWRVRRVVEERVGETLKAVLKFTQPVTRKATKSALRVLVSLSVSSMLTPNILYKLNSMASTILTARQMGVPVDDEVAEYAKRVLEVTSLLMAATQYSGGYGSTETESLGIVGRRAIIPIELLTDMLPAIGVPEQEVQRIAALLQDIGRNINVYENAGAYEVPDTVIAYIVEVVARHVTPILTTVVAEVMTQALERVEIIVPIGAASILASMMQPTTQKM